MKFTVKECRNLFTTVKLEFGNEEQIRARNVLMAAEELRELLNTHGTNVSLKCERCGGYGECEYYDSDRGVDYTDICDDCDGEGTLAVKESYIDTLDVVALAYQIEKIEAKLNLTKK